ncbi:MAG: hypothetical protein AAB257_08660 [Nitrospinota bacterium]
MPIISMIIGIICLLLLIEPEPWDQDLIGGLIFVSIVGLVIGIVSVSTQKRGRGMAISGIILTSIGFLFGLSQLVK